MPAEILATEDQEQSALLDVKAVANLLTCSPRHVFRLADGGKMPPPLRIGACVRWSRQSILEWIDSGCPASRGGR